ncbi:MAG: AbrB/MazE/SpoVT family DNA-binding domain-containing protein [Bacilli bacterium]|nr:AbrB/MazE/SpoVT family DNA-binding domain-containing protein [Bacilli bacterium]
MNYTGVIRRVDELGRIVIPVEIRRLLNIKEGENLEFIIKDKCIELKKKSLIEENFSFFTLISEQLDAIVEGKFIITDREKVFSSNNREILNKKIDNKIINLLQKNESSKLESVDLYFDNELINSTFYIYPYSFENDIGGFIILYDIKKIDEYNKLIKFLINYIHSKFSL